MANQVAEVQYRPVPGWPRHRVGSDRSVWFLEPRRSPKLSESKVIEARRLRAEGWAFKDLGAKYRVTWTAVRLALTGRTWQERRWRRLDAIEAADAGPAVRMFDDQGRKHSRSVDLLYRAAFDPDSLPAACLARIPPRAPQPPSPPRARPPVPVLPAIASAEVPELLNVGRADVGDPTPDKVHHEQPPAIVEDDDLGDGPARGSRHGRARLDEAKVVEARRLHAEGWSYKALCERYGIGRVTLHYALVGKTWSHVPMVC